MVIIIGADDVTAVGANEKLVWISEMVDALRTVDIALSTNNVLDGFVETLCMIVEIFLKLKEGEIVLTI